MLEDESQYNVIRLRGLPYSATATDVLSFLKGVNTEKGEKAVHFSSGSYGRSTGEVFVEVCSPEDVNLAMKHDREHMGGRYIEIFRSSRAQLDWECRGAEKSGGSGGVVRLRGLPYGCSVDDIRDFFKGITISDNGVTIQVDESGRETGEAFIEVETDRDVEKALDRHKKSIGHRYIEVFRTNRGDIRPVSNRMTSYNRPSPYPTQGRGGGGRQFGRGRGGSYRQYQDNNSNYSSYDRGTYNRGNTQPQSGDPNTLSYPPVRPLESAGKHAVRMRGLPYSVTVRDIQTFFSPLIPINILIERDESGRLSGEGEVSFGSHDDAVEAMRKDRSHIGTRYIELFLQSKNDVEGVNPSGAPQQTYESSGWPTDTAYTSFSSTDPRGRVPHQYQQQYQQQTVTSIYQQTTPAQPAVVAAAGNYGYGVQQQPQIGGGVNTSISNYGYGVQQQQQQPHAAGSGAAANTGGTGTWY